MLARLHISAGDYPAALADCGEAETLDIHSGLPYEAEARAELLSDQLPEALEAQSTAIARGPVKPGQYVMLATILHQMNEPGLAAAAMRMAAVLKAGG
jgi:hypothetical protein